MSKVVLHPSAKKSASLVLRQLIEANPARLMVFYRNQDGEMEVACCDEWDNEDLALGLCLGQVWFNQLIMDSDDE